MDSRVLDELKMALNNGDCENEKQNRILAICGQYEGDERLLCNAVLEFISDIWLPRSIDKNMRIDYEGSENESVYGGLCDILKASSCLLFNAMCAESMFLKTHKIEFAELLFPDANTAPSPCLHPGAKMRCVTRLAAA